MSLAYIVEQSAHAETTRGFAILAVGSNTLAVVVGFVHGHGSDPWSFFLGIVAAACLVLVPVYLTLRPRSRHRWAALWIVRVALLVIGGVPFAVSGIHIWMALVFGQFPSLIDPTWLIFLTGGIFAMAFAALPRDMRRVLPVELCRRCRYELTGLDGSICPECGLESPRPNRW